MTNVFTCLMKKKFGNGNGSGMDRESIGNGSAKTSRKLFTLLFCLLFVGVGNVWGMNSNYTIGSKVTSLVDGDYVAWGTSTTSLATSIGSNWVYCGSTKADWIVFKVVKVSSSYYLQNTADSKYVYSSADKKVSFDASSKTAITLATLSGTSDLVYGGSSIGYYTFNSSGIRPYKSNKYTDAFLYKVNAFSVTYDANGADTGSVPTDNGNYLSGATVTAKSNSGSLTRTGYNFVGWNTRADGEGTDIAATGLATFTITVSTTLYAKWESAAECENDPAVGAASQKGSVSSTSFTVQCEDGITNLGGEGCSITSYGFVMGTSTEPNVYYDDLLEVGKSYTVAETAFEFTKSTGLTPGQTYYLRPYAENGYGIAYGTETTITLLNEYSIDLDKNNKDASGSDDGIAAAVVNATSLSNITEPTRTGYTIEGYYTDAACTAANKVANAEGEFVASITDWTDSNGKFIGTADGKLYTKWTPERYTITSTLSHCSSSPSIPSSYDYTGSAAGLSYTISADDGYLLPSSITVSGTTYTWSQATGALALTGTINGDVSISITAQPVYTVTLDPGTGSVAGSTSLTQASYGASVTLPTPTAPNANWTFAGWKESSAVSSETTTAPTLKSAGSYTPASNITLYAVYKQVKSTTSTATCKASSSDHGDFTGSSTSWSYTNGSTQLSWSFSGNYYTGGTPHTFTIGKNSSTGTVSITGGGVITQVVATLSDDTYCIRSVSSGASVGSISSLQQTITFTSGSGTSVSMYGGSGNNTEDQCRITQLVITYKPVVYLSSPCTELGTIGGSVNWSNAATAVVSWDNLDHVSSWTVKYKTHAAGAYGTWAGEQTVYSKSTTNDSRKVTITGLTPCTDYDFQIIANPASGYCDKDQTINDSQTHNWSVGYSGCSGVTKTAGDEYACGSSSLVATFTAEDYSYTLPSTVSVSIGGNAQTQGTDFTWSVSAGVGTLTIAPGKQTGNIVIDVDGVHYDCEATPELGTASLSGAFNLSTVGISCASITPGSYCAVESGNYGFIWYAGTGDKEIDDDGVTTIAISSGDYSSGSFNAEISSTFSTGNTYTFRAYATNTGDKTGYSDAVSFTPRKVTYNSNGGSGVDAVYVNSGGTVSAPSSPAKTGYTFSKWQLNGADYSFSSTVTTNITLDAVWTAIQYDVTLSKCTGGSSAADQTVLVTYDATMPDTIKAVGNTAITVPTKNGHTFLGYWDVDATTGGTQYYSYESSTLASAANWDKTTAATLYERWQANQYSVSLNNQSATTAGQTSVTATYGQPMPSIAENLPSKTNYIFGGYYSDTNGEGKKYYNADGTSANNYAKYSSDPTQHVLYAYWIPELKFSVNGAIDGTLTRRDNTAMPSSATVPSACGSCWEFIGWSTDSEEDEAPAYAGGATHAFGEPTTLYAVFGKTEFQLISSTEDLVDKDNYVIGFISNSNVYALSNSAHSYYTTDAAVTDVTSKYHSNANGECLYNVAANNIWKFTGSDTEGQLYNAAAEKFINLGNEETILSTTEDLSFEVDEDKQWTITNSTKYLGGYSSDNGYGFEASSSSDFEERYHPYIYHQSSATYSTQPSCSTYTIAWKKDNADYSTGAPTTTATQCEGIETMPDAPADDALSGCSDKFMGWSEEELYGTGNDAPADLFADLESAPVIDENKTFHAVFATIDMEHADTIHKPLSVTISNFTEITTSYTTIYNHTYAVDSIGETGSVKLQAYGVYNNSNGIQMNSGKGTYIKNLYAFPGPIKKIEMTWTASGKNSPTIYVAKDAIASTSSTNKGTMDNSKTSHIITLDEEDGYNYFFFDGSTLSGACYMSELKITYVDTIPAHKDYRTTCDLQLGDINGSVTFTDPTEAVVSWDNISNVSSWTVEYKTGAGSYSTTNVSDDAAYTKVTTNDSRKVTITGLTCGTDYDIRITATPSSGYRGKSETLENQNSGKYNITKSASNGSFTTKISDEAVTEACDGATVDISATPSDGYSFSSWTINKETSGTVTPSNASAASTSFTMPADNVTVIASFTPITYDITYYDGDEEDDDVEFSGSHADGYPTTHTYGTATALKSATKTDYNFVGWYLDHECTGVPLTSLAADGYTADITLYAKWVKDDKWVVTIDDYSNGTVEVDYEGNESDFTSDSREIAKNTVLTITATANTGYDLTALTVDGEDFTSGDTHTLTANVTVAATFTAQTYTITYKDKDNTTYSGDNIASLPATHTYGTATALVNGSKEGYTFHGWYTDADCEVSAGSSIGATAYTTGITLYAKWSINSYTLTWSTDGDALTGDYTKGTTEYGTTIVEPNTPTKTGYTFASWSPAVAETMPAANTTYTATWTINNYTVKWSVNNDNTYAEGTPTTSADYNTNISAMPTAPSSCDGKKVFVGWRAAKITGTSVAAPSGILTEVEDFPVITDNTTFYAVFADVTGGDKIELTFPDDNSANNGLTSDHYVSDWTAKVGSFAFTISNFNNNNWKNSWTYIKCGRKDNTSTGSIKTDAAISFRVDSVYIKIDAINAEKVNSAKVYVSGTSDFTISSNVDITQSAGLQGIAFASPATNKYYKVEFDCQSNTSNGFVQISKVIFKQKLDTLNFVTTCYCLFTDDNGDEDHNWSTSSNWLGGEIPTLDYEARIQKPMTVDVTDAKAAAVILDQTTGNTGKLEISAGKSLVVDRNVRKTTDGTTMSATAEEDIVIGSTLAAGTGALVMGDHNGTNKATVNFAVKAKKDGSGHWINQFIGTPFNDENAVLYNYYGTQVYQFCAAHNGTYGGSGSDWTKLTGSDGMTPFMGYNLLRSKTDDHVLWMQGTLNRTDQNKELALVKNDGEDKTENMFANSWMAPIHIDAFSKNGSDFGGADATIYIFNAGTPEDQAAAGAGAADATAAGQYIVLPVASAPWTSPTVTVIPAMQAFSVYSTAADQTLTLDYNKLVYTPALTSVGVVPTRAPRRAAREAEAEDESPEVIRLHVQAESGYAANAYVLGGLENFTEGFDNGWDGRFIAGDEEAPQLYIPSQEGNMAISCVPDIEGTVLGFRKGSEDSQYMFSFEYEGEENWYLNDLQKQESTQITDGNTYVFTSGIYDSEARFIISATPIHKISTGVDGVGDGTKARKLLIEDKLYIIRGGRMYSAEGALVK